MKETAKIQAQIDALAARRTYWRDMRNFLTATQSKEMAQVFKKRIENLRESFVEVFDCTNPSESIEIAKAQAKREVLNLIIKEMDSPLCELEIDTLDKMIIQKNEELKRVVGAIKQINPYEVNP